MYFKCLCGWLKWMNTFTRAGLNLVLPCLQGSHIWSSSLICNISRDNWDGNHYFIFWSIFNLFGQRRVETISVVAPESAVGGQTQRLCGSARSANIHYYFVAKLLVFTTQCQVISFTTQVLMWWSAVPNSFSLHCTLGWPTSWATNLTLSLQKSPTLFSQIQRWTWSRVVCHLSQSLSVLGCLHTQLASG